MLVSKRRKELEGDFESRKGQLSSRSDKKTENKSLESQDAQTESKSTKNLQEVD